jgi:hypothetical protein
VWRQISGQWLENAGVEPATAEQPPLRVKCGSTTIDVRAAANELEHHGGRVGPSMLEVALESDERPREAWAVV